MFNFLRTATHNMEDGEQKFYDSPNDKNINQYLGLMAFKDKIITELKNRSKDIRFEDCTKTSFNIFICDNDIPDPITVDLSNIYGKYLNEPDRLEEFILHFTDLGSEAIAVARGIESEISIPQLAVVLRHIDYLDFLDPDINIYQPFYGDLIALMVFYHPSFVVNVRIQDLEKLKLNKKTAWAIAAENLRTKYDDLEVVVENQGSKCLTSDTGLATGHLWLLNQTHCDKNFNAIVINKETYVYAEMDNKDGTNVLAGYAAHLVNKQDTLSDNLVSCLDGYFYASYLSDNAWLPFGE